MAPRMTKQDQVALFEDERKFLLELGDGDLEDGIQKAMAEHDMPEVIADIARWWSTYRRSHPELQLIASIKGDNDG